MIRLARWRKASGELARRGSAMGLQSLLPNASIFRHHARPASCPTQTIACRASKPALTASPQARIARPMSGGQVS
ncbi:MAG: hypothetical protein GX463_05310 [Methanothrix sp.]|nr:hypothetical protein [Methanothrix sp.]HPM26532.1 hypothetical protein [Methanothrix sp.]